MWATCFSALSYSVLRPHRACVYIVVLHSCSSMWEKRERESRGGGREKGDLQDKGSISVVSMALTRNSLGNYWLTVWFNWRQNLSPRGSHRQITLHLSLSHLSSYIAAKRNAFVLSLTWFQERDNAAYNAATKKSKVVNQSRHTLDILLCLDELVKWVLNKSQFQCF